MLTQQQLATSIRQIVDEWKYEDGLCADLADVIHELHPETKIYSDDELGAKEYTHTIIVFEGRYYDAEAPEGVDDWRQLPIYARQRKEGFYNF